MPPYRLYHVDGAGRIMSADWLDASDDEAAVDAARLIAGDGACEVWQQHRLVIRLERGGISPPSDL